MKFLTGLVMGATVGAAVAVFENGNLSIEDIKNKTNKLKNMVIDTKNDIVFLADAVTDTLPKAVEGISSAIETYNQEIEPLTNNLKDNLDKLRG